MQRKTVVLVCMVDSIHVARWIAHFDPTEVKFILFPSGPNRRVHPKIVEMIERGKQFDNQMTLVPFRGRLSLPLWAMDRLFNDRIRGLLLRRVLTRFEPDFVHALEFQHAGYVTIRALEDKNLKTPFIATNYGSDIYWFQRFPSHKARIQRVLDRADRYSAECNRDYSLAQEFGFTRGGLPGIPNAGGLEVDVDILRSSARHQRDTISIKGYHGWAGQALLALRAIGASQRLRNEYRIVVFSANLITFIYAHWLRLRYKPNISIFMKGALQHDDLLAILRKTLVYVGISRTDGISTSMLEALACGATPVQTESACAVEWFDHLRQGILINLESASVKTLKREIETACALTSSGLLGPDAEYLERLRKRLDPHLIMRIARQFYDS